MLVFSSEAFWKVQKQKERKHVSENFQAWDVCYHTWDHVWITLIKHTKNLKQERTFREVRLTTRPQHAESNCKTNKWIQYTPNRKLRLKRISTERNEKQKLWLPAVISSYIISKIPLSQPFCPQNGLCSTSVWTEGRWEKNAHVV